MAAKVNIDKKLLEMAKNDIARIEETVRDQHNTQKRLLDLYRQEYVPDQSISMTPEIEANLYLSNIETQMPVVDDHLGWINYVGREENDEEFADILQLKMDNMFDYGRLREAAHQASKDAKIMRNGLTQAKMILDTEQTDKGLQRVFKGLRFAPVDPKTFYPALGYTGLDIAQNEADFLAFGTPMNVRAIKRIYDLKVDPEGSLDKYGMFKEKDKEDKYGDHAIIWEYYYMDDDVKKYPYGRVLMWVGEQDIVERAIDFRPPYFMVQNYSMAHTAQGISEIELIKSMVEGINAVLSENTEMAVTQNKTVMTGRDEWINSLEQSVKKYVLQGKVIPANPGDFSKGTPTQMSETAIRVPDQLKDIADSVSGVHDYYAGKQKGDSSGKAIQLLQDAAMRRVRLHLSQDVKPYLQDIGEFALNVVQKYDKQVQMLRKQTDPMSTEWVKYDPADMRDTKFDVIVEVGAADRAEKTAEVMAMYKEGLATDEDVINVMPVRDKKAKLQRLREQRGVAGQMERNAEIADAEKELNGLADSILGMMDKETPTENDNTRLKLKEDKVTALVRNYKELTDGQAWTAIPVNMQGRVVQAAFVKQPEAVA